MLSVPSVIETSSGKLTASLRRLFLNELRSLIDTTVPSMMHLSLPLLIDLMEVDFPLGTNPPKMERLPFGATFAGDAAASGSPLSLKGAAFQKFVKESVDEIHELSLEIGIVKK